MPPLGNPIYGYKALTISPPLNIHLSKNELHQKYIDIIVRFLRRCSKHYIIYPEIQHTTARLHYHICFHLHDSTAYYKGFHLIQRLGHCKCDPLRTEKDRLRWILYCRKDTPLTGSVLSPSPVPILPTKPKRRTSTKWEAVCKTNTILHDLTESLNDDCIGDNFTLNFTW